GAYSRISISLVAPRPTRTWDPECSRFGVHPPARLPPPHARTPAKRGTRGRSSLKVPPPGLARRLAWPRDPEGGGCGPRMAGDAGFPELVEAAPEDRSNRASVEPFAGECGDRECCQRRATHRVDVAQRVGRGDLSVGVRVIDNRREEIDRLHERRSALPPEHTRIVRGPEVDEDAVVLLRGNVTQHLSELACGEFARSTGAGDHLRQASG